MFISRKSSWVGLPNRVCLHYRIYSEDLEHHPVLFLLHPPALSLEFFDLYFKDCWLRENFTLVAFDSRGHGKTTAPLSSTRDVFTDASDIAFAQAKLGLKPAHILAVGPMTQITALSFALLFPNNCISLALNWVTDPCQLEPCLGPIEQLLRTWPTPRDYDQCEAYAHEASMYYAPNDTDTDRHLRDQLVEHFLTRYPPTASDQLAATELVLCRRRVFGEELAHVQQPVLILQKEADNDFYTADMATSLQRRLKSSPTTEVVYLPESTPDAAALFMPDLIMTHLQFFLERELCKPERINRERWLTPPQQALFRLANLMKDPSIGLRNPFSQDSFSMVTVEGRAYWESFMKDIRQEQTRAFYPLNHTGKPFRKFSDRRAPFLHPTAGSSSQSFISLQTTYSISVASGTEMTDGPFERGGFCSSVECLPQQEHKITLVLEEGKGELSDQE